MKFPINVPSKQTLQTPVLFCIIRSTTFYTLYTCQVCLQRISRVTFDAHWIHGTKYIYWILRVTSWMSQVWLVFSRQVSRIGSFRLHRFLNHSDHIHYWLRLFYFHKKDIFGSTGHIIGIFSHYTFFRLVTNMYNLLANSIWIDAESIFTKDALIWNYVWIKDTVFYHVYN